VYLNVLKIALRNDVISRVNPPQPLAYFISKSAVRGNTFKKNPRKLDVLVHLTMEFLNYHICLTLLRCNRWNYNYNETIFRQ